MAQTKTRSTATPKNAKPNPKTAAAAPATPAPAVPPTRELKLTPAEAEAMRAAGRAMAAEHVRVRRPSPAVEHDRAVDALRRFQKAAKGKAYEKDIIGIDVGLIADARYVSSQFAVRVHVRAKVHPQDLPISRRVPAFEPVTGVPVAVVESNFRHATGPAQAPFVVSPKGGAGAGSMGLLVDVHHPVAVAAVGMGGIAPAFLTCAHVLGSGNPRAALAAGVDVVDGAGADVGRSLSEFWAYDAEVDAALIVPANRTGLSWGLRNAPMTVSGIAWVTADDVSRQTPIYTVDAATGNVIAGQVVSIWSDRVLLSDGNGGTAVAMHPIQIRPTGSEPFARPGDSGSAVYMNGRYVGLIVGVDANGNAVATQLATVARRLFFYA